MSGAILRPCAGCGFTACQCASGAVERREARIAELEREVARLEALIVEQVASGFVTDEMYAEAAAIRSRR